MLTLTKCDLCGSVHFTTLFKQTDFVYYTTEEYFTYMRCENCGLVFLNPRPEIGQMERYYPDAYSFYRVGKWGNIKEHLKNSIYVVYYANLQNGLINLLLRLILFPMWLLFKCYGVTENIRQYRKYPFLEKHQGKRVLDVGCGSGTSFHPFENRYSMVWLNQRGYQCEGVEIDGRACEVAAKNGMRVYQGLFDAVELEAEAYDVVRMNYSLEHVDFPSDYFRQAYRVLKKGGELIVSVPNYDGITYKVFPEAVEAPRHLFYFNQKTLTSYFTKNGFEVRSVSTDPTPEVFKYVVEHYPGWKQYEPGNGGKRIKIKNFDLLPFYRVASSRGLGDDITIVGVKK